MLYVTAHLVSARQLGKKQGVNAFCYRSAGQVPVGDALAAMIDRVADGAGMLVGCFIELPPGGNGVHAYVDLLLEDEGSLAGALAEVRQRFLGGNLDVMTERLEHGTVVRCYVSTRVDRQAALADLERGALAATSSMPEPLCIIMDKAPGGAVYQLETDSLERLRKIHHAGWQGAPLRVHEEAAKPDVLLPHVATVVTGLHRRSLEALGGLLVRTREGTVVLEWKPSWDEPRVSGQVADSAEE